MGSTGTPSDRIREYVPFDLSSQGAPEMYPLNSLYREPRNPIKQEQQYIAFEFSLWGAPGHHQTGSTSTYSLTSLYREPRESIKQELSLDAP